MQRDRKRFGMIKNKVHKFGEEVLNLYLIALFVVMPLICKGGYHATSTVKWSYFCHVSFGYQFKNIFIPGFLIILSLCFVVEVIFFKSYVKKFTKADLMILLYGVVVFLSGKFAYPSFFVTDVSQIVLGYPGWYMGQLAQLSFILVYFFTKRYWNGKHIIVDLAIVASSMVFFLAILNRFNIDVFGFWDTIDSLIRNDYVSTQGNINWYVCYLVVLFPLSVYSYLNENNKVKKIVYGLFVGIGIATLVTQGSDSAFLVLVVLSLYLLKNEDNKKLIELLIICSGACILIGLLQIVFSGSAYIPNRLSGLFTKSMVPYLLFCLGVLFEYKNELFVKFKKLAFDILPILFVLVVIYVVLNSFDLLPEQLRTYGYLRLNDSWGNNRGGIYRAGVISFIRFALDHPYVWLFGAGPDQYANMIFTYNYEELVIERSTVFVSCAHNEFLNTLCNYGILGFISFYGFWYFVIFDKKRENTLFNRMCICAIICYLVNSFVSIQQIVGAPYLFIVAGMLQSNAEI